jgi:hypothetical protein
MMTPPLFMRIAEKKTPPDGVSGVDALGIISAVGIEMALVKRINDLFWYQRFDNEAIDQLPAEMVPAPGLPRIQSLTGKMRPNVWAGSVPLTETGDVNPRDVPDYPAIIVCSDKLERDFELGILDIKIWAGVFDRSKERQGRWDCINIMESLEWLFFQENPVGNVAAILSTTRDPYPVRWQYLHKTPFPYYFAEMTCRFELGPITEITSTLMHHRTHHADN